jgi:ABC-type multidrug transport system ATPase subunit
MFYGKLHLNLTYDEIAQRVDDLIDTLCLKHVAHSVVGGTAFRGISGGECKRLIVGIAVITNPSK